MTPESIFQTGKIVSQSRDFVEWHGLGHAVIHAHREEAGWIAEGSVHVGDAFAPVTHGCGFTDPTFQSSELAICECIRRLQEHIASR